MMRESSVTCKMITPELMSRSGLFIFFGGANILGNPCVCMPVCVVVCVCMCVCVCLFAYMTPQQSHTQILPRPIKTSGDPIATKPTP